MVRSEEPSEHSSTRLELARTVAAAADGTPKVPSGSTTTQAEHLEGTHGLETLFRQGTEPTTLGRYVVLDTLGEGGMGVVLRAFDRELDRPVALKVLRGSLDEHYTVRLRREAQAMAKLSHPNVVQVYEVGQIEGRTFVAMELVKGQTARAWMRQQPRPDWRACVRLFIQLGEGLAAAHERGLVHRDFKPGNAIIDDKGRARVLDFGLARHDEDDDEERESSASERARTGAQRLGPMDTPLTQTGMVMGTPAYMPPEQMLGRETDARSDQFSFCVALYEAVYGERPFEGTTPNVLMVSVIEGNVRPAPRGSAVPATLRMVLLRGLATKAEQRWPSMEALLGELRRRVAPRGRRWMAVGVTVGLAALGGGLAYGQYVQVRDRCTGAWGQLQGVWDDARRGEVKDAILGTGLSYAPGTWERVEQRLDEYTDAWAHEHTEACEATSVRHEQSEEHMGLRMGCLRDRRQQLRATVNELSRADATVVKNAVQAVASLPMLSRCADLEALEAEVPPPEDPAVAERADALAERLAEAVAKQMAGKYDEGLAVANEVVAEATTLGHRPLLTRAWVRQGSLQEKTGDYEGAVRTLRQAYRTAIIDRMLEEAASSSAQLVLILGSRLERFDEARRWGEDADPLSLAVEADAARARYLNHFAGVAFAEGKADEAREIQEQAVAIMEASLGPDDFYLAFLLGNLGAMATVQGKLDEAHELRIRELSIDEKTFGPDHPNVAPPLMGLGMVAKEQGKLDEARGWFERARAISEETLGQDHPTVALVLNNLGVVAAAQGKPNEAYEHFERALAIREKTLGPDHPLLVSSLTNLGTSDFSRGELDKAHGRFQRALAIGEKTLGPDHPRLAPNLNNLGEVARAEGKLDEARDFYRRALAIGEKAMGPDHPKLAVSLTGLGNVAREQGKLDEALDVLERAQAIVEHALGPDHRELAPPLASLGKVLVERDEPAKALIPLERALAIHTSQDADALELARIDFTLAQALWATPTAQGGDRPRAHALAEQARDAFTEHGSGAERDLTEVRTWLDEHRVP